MEIERASENDAGTPLEPGPVTESVAGAARRASPLRRLVRAGRAHLFVTAVIACAILGAGLRFVPSSAASPSGAPASTACAAK